MFCFFPLKLGSENVSGKGSCSLASYLRRGNINVIHGTWTHLANRFNFYNNLAFSSYIENILKGVTCRIPCCLNKPRGRCVKATLY